uniref:Gag-pol polyprotein n=1 Tax=Solanum tuberosum TaxID=4113 RepID=M1DRU7_SOLTU
MVADMRSWMNIFLARLSRLSSKESKATMLIGYMGIARLMIHVQQVEKDQLKDREEFENKRAKTSWNESGKKKSNLNRSSFQNKQKGLAPSSASAPKPRNKYEYNSQNSQNFRARPTHSQGSKAQRGSKTPACAKCGRSHSGMCRDDSTSCFKYGQNGADGEGNHLYAIASHQEQENSPDVVTGMIKVFTFYVYAFLDPGASLYFVTPYVANKFDNLPEQLLEPYNVSTPVGLSIMAGVNEENMSFIHFSNAASQERYHDHRNKKFYRERGFHLLGLAEKVPAFHA